MPAAADGGAPELRVRELILDRRGERRIVWYFYKSGPALNTSYWRHQIGVALRRFRNPAAGDLLIRLETAAPGVDVERGRAVLQDFLSRSLPPVLASLP